MFTHSLLAEVRSRFHHVDHCPYQGQRIFFEYAGGALTLKTVTETSAALAAIPDNQGRDNPASAHLVDVISTARNNMRCFLGADNGEVFAGESGTEILFRLIRTALNGTEPGGQVLGSTLEHPATTSACAHWAEITGREFTRIPHDNDTGSVSVEAYAEAITAETRVATIIHTSPVTGMSVDVGAIAAAIRAVSPQCYIIVDGIQHAAHGGLSVDEYRVDGYAISPYKVFSRHGYGVGWVSDRLSALPHEKLLDTPDEQWELGTRDTAAYATFTDVVEYLDWLGSNFTNATDRRERILAAGREIHRHEKALVRAMLHGTDGQRGLAGIPTVNIIGGIDNARREGLVTMTLNAYPAADVVKHLGNDGIRVHVRKADHYSKNILTPLSLDACVRVSMCHYNSIAEVGVFLQSVNRLLE